MELEDGDQIDAHIEQVCTDYSHAHRPQTQMSCCSWVEECAPATNILPQSYPWGSSCNFPQSILPFCIIPKHPTSQILDVRRVVCPEQISFREFYAHASRDPFLHFAMSDPTLSQTDLPRDEKPKLMFTVMFQGRSKSSLFMIQCRSKTNFGGVTRHKVCTEASVHSSEIAG